MSYADRGAFVIGCRCQADQRPQPARFSAFGSRRGHFDIVSNLVGGVGDTAASALGEVRGIFGAMTTPMKVGMAGMLLAGVLLVRGDIKL